MFLIFQFLILLIFLFLVCFLLFSLWFIWFLLIVNNIWVRKLFDMLRIAIPCTRACSRYIWLPQVLPPMINFHRSQFSTLKTFFFHVKYWGFLFDMQLIISNWISSLWNKMMPPVAILKLMLIKQIQWKMLTNKVLIHFKK